MEFTLISLRTVVITILRMQARIRVETLNVSVVEGDIFDFRCKYEDGQQNNTKYFCYDKDENDDEMCSVYLIRTRNHDQWHEDGRFSLYDNTTGAFFDVRGENLTSGDGGTYRCGVEVDHARFMDLNVSRENPPENLTHPKLPFPVTASPISPVDVPLSKLHLSLLVTAAMFTSAVLFICLFTLCLRLAVRRRRPGPRQNREISSEYETMMPGVGPEPGRRCSSFASDRADPSALPPPPDASSYFTSKHQASTVTFGHHEYDEVDSPKHIDQYQDLNLSQLEDHVYHSLNRLCGPKDGPLVSKSKATVEG